MNKKYLLMILAVIMLFSTSGCIMRSTGGNEVGIRTIKFSFFGEKGVEDKVYAPGRTYFFMPFVNDWHTLDIKLQNLEMTSATNRGDRRTRDDLLFKTIDGNDISLDVIVQFRINPEKAAYIIQYVAPNNELLKERIIRTIARSKPRDIFGELGTEEFYVASKRAEQAEKARKVLQDMLYPMGIIVEKVGTVDYRFNAKYQKAIEDKKVADQLVQKNKSSQHAMLEEYIKKLEEVKGEVNILIAEINGQFLQRKIEADVYYEQQKLLAEAIMAEGIAEAKAITEMNKALEGAGGEAMVKLKIAEALIGKKIILLPVSEGGMNLKTTDINKLIETMGIKSLSQ